MKHAALIARWSLFLCFFALTLWADEDKENGQKQEPKKATNSKEISWMSYDLGLDKAKTEDKHVFIDFTAKWCGWCKKMDKETFSRPEVIEMLNNNFIPVRVDGDSNRELNINGYKITERNLTRHEFGVRGLPAFWFLKSDGTKLGVIRGYKPADYMMEALAYVKDYKYDSTRTKNPKGKKEKSDN